MSEPSYRVLWVTGDYPDRQRQANEAGCDGYIEHHFNALVYDDEKTTQDNPALCVLAHNASQASIDWANDYCRRTSEAFGHPNRGAIVRAFKERGDYNLRFTEMPAILVEPLYVSDPTQAKLATSESGQNKLATILVRSILHSSPGGGLFAFSTGHLGKTSNPHDRGAPVYGRDDVMEADLAEAVLQKAEVMLCSLKPGINSDAPFEGL